MEQEKLEQPLSEQQVEQNLLLKQEVLKLAKHLNEHYSEPLVLLTELVKLLGVEKCWEYIAQAEAIEANGGMLTSDQSRRRTFGGVFFRTVRYSLPPKERNDIFKRAVSKPDFDKEWRTPKKTPYTKQQEIHQPQPAKLPYSWDDVDEDYKALESDNNSIGTASVKITIIGQPLKIIEKPSAVLMTFRSGTAPALPKGLPTPPTNSTVFLVIVASKQWQKVNSLTKIEGDKLIIEGWPIYDGKLGTITVLAQSITSVNIQRMKQEEQRKKSAEQQAPASASK